MLQAGLRTASILLALAIAACAAPGPAFVPAAPPADDRTLVYVYREDTQAGNAAGITIFVDEDEIVTLNRKGYTRFYLVQGERVIRVKEESSDPRIYYLQFDGGDTRYFRLAGSDDARSGIVDLEFDHVARGAGEKEIVLYQLQPPRRDVF
jgi:hypothetical protein